MADLSIFEHAAAGAASLVAGVINAAAGGGTLLVFPILTAIGLPTVRANATCTVALVTGPIGGAYAQRRDLAGLGRTMRTQVVICTVFGVAGSALVIAGGESIFRRIVPFLILLACAALAVQPRVRTWLNRRAATRGPRSPGWEHVAIAGAAIYGGYFGAGLGIMLLAILGLLSDLPINRVNAVKQLLGFFINIAATLFFAVSGQVEWSLIAVMAPATLIGGHLGGRLASRLDPTLFRRGVITYGVVVACIYLVT